MTQAFAGLRILDFSQVLAAPFGVQQLAMLGADVIKIEQPGSGDMTRGLMSNASKTGMTPSFLSCNLNKRSLSLDLKHPAALNVVQRLVQQSDALIENMRPGAMQRLGMDYDSLCKVKPDLVYCSVSGYGQTGPKAKLAAFDGAIQAASGMMAISGHPETGPVRAGYFAVDMATAMNAAFALSAALYRRLATGEGQHVDVAMMDTAMVLQAAQVGAYKLNGTEPELLGNQSPTRNPTANVFATMDGFVQIIALKEPQAAAFFDLLNLADLLQQPEFIDATARTKHADRVIELVAPLIAAQSTAHWLDALNAVGVPCAPIQDLAVAASDEQFDHRSAFAEITHPVTGEPVSVVATGHTANTDAPSLRHQPPELGANTQEILAEYGFTDTEVAALRQAGALG